MYNSIPQSAFRRVTAGEFQIPVWAFRPEFVLAGTEKPSIVAFDVPAIAHIRTEFVAQDDKRQFVEVKPMTMAEGVPSVLYLTPAQPRFEIPAQNIAFELVRNEVPKADVKVPVIAFYNKVDGVLLNEAPVIEAKHELGIPAFRFQIVVLDSKKPLVTLG